MMGERRKNAASGQGAGSSEQPAASGQGAGSAVQSAAAAGILAAAVLLSLLLPSWALFSEGGYLAVYIRLPESRRMLVEIGILFLLVGGIFSLRRSGRLRIWLAAAVSVLFCWLHVVFLPMVVSGLYLAVLLLAGRFLRLKVFRLGESAGFPADFILGSSFVISLFCLLSALGAGEIRILRFLSILLGAVLLVWYLPGRLVSGRGSGVVQEAGAALERASLPVRAAWVFVLVIVLIQAGRINLALDFDTLWYGVRSEYILALEGGIYEDPGMVGMVYTYSKGWEILTLPLCDLASHSYLLCFNLWLMVLGLAVTARLARCVLGRLGVPLAVTLTAAVPGIMNMAISAKTDMITWLIQLIMLEYFFLYVKESGRRQGPAHALILTAGAYLLSLTMKPTALVFSTAVFGMMGIYLLASGRLSLRARAAHWAALLFPAAALFAVWARTMKLTGMPVTSVFTSIFALLGFEMKYPFAASALPQNYEEGDPVLTFVQRLYSLLFLSKNTDSGHIVMAWGSSLLVVLLVFIALSVLGFPLFRREGGRRLACPLRRAGHTVFWPFLAVNLLSLFMLYQVDGNYFMLLYTMLLFIAGGFFSELKYKKGRQIFLLCLLPMLLYNAVILSQTSWAWCAGFTPVQVVNKGYVDHRAENKERMLSKGNRAIWQMLETDPANRVIAFGEHPHCLQFPCNVQSYKDITAPWGNVELVNTPEAFEEYMEYAQTDYVYAEAGFLGEGNWAWSYGLLRDLIARGTLTEPFYEEGNFLAKRAVEKVPQEEAAENLKQFDALYRVYENPAGG